ncbi:MAG TPA: cysteine--tRNA ligase [Polyangiaceae bacterium]|nr:cysteine--tRNA ligase [Polyangiaceae bacterium]
MTPIERHRRSQPELKLYDSLTRSTRVFEPLGSGPVGIYSCGPTVYARQHLGNMRPYVFADLLRRTLLSAGYAVKHIVNITDVGHLTSDADDGADKVELAAARTHTPALAITEHFTEVFQADLRRLGVLAPDVWAKASAHVPEQIAMISGLEARGFVYRTSDGIYFDTSLAPHYGELSGLRASARHSRVAEHTEKRQPADFALWKFSPTSGPKRQLEWPSPWGIGFPGWHIECSAMASRYLGSQFEIHTGGVDHVAVHHTNEIVQAEHALGVRPWVKYWMHGAWLTMEGAKIAKSSGLAPNLDDLGAIGVGPAAFRYYLMTAHYRSPLDLSLEALRAADTAFERLSQFVARSSGSGAVPGTSDAWQTWRQQFYDALYDDLDAPRAIAVLWCILADASLPASERATLIAELGGVLGLVWKQPVLGERTFAPDIARLVAEREHARRAREFSRADALRAELTERGFTVEDSPTGPVLTRTRAATV